MSSPSSSGTSLPPKPPTIEKRLPLALALMMLVLLVSQYLFKPAPGPKPATPSPTPKAAAVQTEKPSAPSAAEATPAQAAAAIPAEGVVKADRDLTTEIDTDQFHVVFSNRGGVAKSWVLKKFRDISGKPLELVNTVSGKAVFAVEARNAKLTVDPNQVLYNAEPEADGTGIRYAFSDGKTAIRKSFRFKRSSYLVDVRSDLTLDGNAVPHFLTWRGGFGDQKVHNAAQTQHTVRYDMGAGKLVTKTAKDAKDGPITDSGNYSFAGLEDSFFATVALPLEGGNPIEIRTYSDGILKLPEQKETVNYPGAGISTGNANAFSLFVGPKDVDILDRVHPKLGQLVDWGTFGVIAKPLFLSLNWVHDHLTNNFGWAIVLVTLVINLALFPLRLSSLKSARKMQKLQPQLQAINAKYKNVALRDPKKAEQNQEVMDLYKREGVNPVGGCLPLVIQLPFFYAFYRVLSIAIELRNASFLWVPDLSSPETLPIHILPILLIATQFLTQRMTPAAGVDPAQQRMMQFMPLMFGFFFYYASAGLVLYWLTGNLVGIGQQLLINRLMPTPPAPPPPAAGKAPVRKSPKSR